MATSLPRVTVVRQPIPRAACDRCEWTCEGGRTHVDEQAQAHRASHARPDRSF